MQEDFEQLNWSRYRDDGILIIPNGEDVSPLTEHLKSLRPNDIKRTFSQGREAEYLDVKIKIKEDGNITTDVFSKNCHSYLPPQSCHPPSVFKGLAIGIGCV